MTTWLIAANTKIYDVFGALAQDETYWPMNGKMVAGDAVYIYLAAPHKQIGFVCEVVETGLGMTEIMDHVAPFIKGDASTGAHTKPFMKLRPTRIIPLEPNGDLSLDQLRLNGLTGMLMGARKLDNNPILWGYIQGVLA